MPTNQQQTTVAAYFAEASAPSIIGTAEAGQHVIDTTTNAGRGIEQVGKSARFLNLARLAESSSEFFQLTDVLGQALQAVARDCTEIQRLSMQVSQHSKVIDDLNARARTLAQTLGYTLP